MCLVWEQTPAIRHVLINLSGCLVDLYDLNQSPAFDSIGKNLKVNKVWELSIDTQVEM